MTKTIELNCKRIWKITGISLWSLATVGLVIGLYFGYNNAFIGVANEGCGQLPSGWKEMCLNNKIKDNSLLIGTLVGNIGNIIGIWLVINYKYKFIELKCKQVKYLSERDYGTLPKGYKK